MEEFELAQKHMYICTKCILNCLKISHYITENFCRGNRGNLNASQKVCVCIKITYIWVENITKGGGCCALPQKRWFPGKTKHFLTTHLSYSVVTQTEGVSPPSWPNRTPRETSDCLWRWTSPALCPLAPWWLLGGSTEGRKHKIS